MPARCSSTPGRRDRPGRAAALRWAARARSSVGQSSGLIIRWSLVRVQAGPLQNRCTRAVFGLGRLVRIDAGPTSRRAPAGTIGRRRATSIVEHFGERDMSPSDCLRRIRPQATRQGRRFPDLTASGARLRPETRVGGSPPRCAMSGLRDSSPRRLTPPSIGGALRSLAAGDRGEGSRRYGRSRSSRERSRPSGRRRRSRPVRSSTRPGSPTAHAVGFRRQRTRRQRERRKARTPGRTAQCPP